MINTKRTIISIALTIVVAFAFQVSAFAESSQLEKQSIQDTLDYSSYEEIIYESFETLEYQINDLERQTELLHELSDLINSGGMRARLGADGVPVEIPNINMVISPASAAIDHFVIGLEIDHSHLSYGDFEAVIELSLQEPPQEVVDFILSYAGIPSDRIIIGYGIFQPTPLHPEYLPLPDVCPVWGYGRNEVAEESNAASRDVRTTLRMGDRNRVMAIPGYSTVGHPLNSAGSRYFTSFHADTWLQGRDVFLQNLPFNRVGNVARSNNNQTLDIAEVNLSVTGSHMSSDLPRPWPVGSRVSNFRGAARTQDLVRSIRGFSRVTDNAVLGTRTGAFTIGGSVFGLYSSVQRY